MTGIDPSRYWDREVQRPLGSSEPIGGEGRISRGWTLSRISIDAILENKSLIALPLSSMVILTLLSIAIFYGLLSFTGFSEVTPEIVMMIVWIYFIAAVVMTFFNVALMGAAMLWLEGGSPTLGYAIQYAMERLWVIVQWALVAAVVNVLISLIRRYISNTVGTISGIGWSVLTFFAVPVVAFEKATPLAAIERSARIIRSTWREAAISNFGILFVFFIFAIIVLFPLFIVLVWVGLEVGFVLLLMAILYLIVLGSIYGAISGVLGTALYRYATTGKVPPMDQEIVMRNPWEF